MGGSKSPCGCGSEPQGSTGVTSKILNNWNSLGLRHSEWVLASALGQGPVCSELCQGSQWGGDT